MALQGRQSQGQSRDALHDHRARHKLEPSWGAYTHACWRLSAAQDPVAFGDPSAAAVQQGAKDVLKTWSAASPRSAACSWKSCSPW